VETLTREHEAAVAATEEVPAAAPPPAAQARPCATCGAPLAPDQDWCLECGTARPDSFAPAPGWRGAAAVLVATGVLAAGAVAAAWAGLSADAKRVAASTTQAALPQPAPPAQPPPAAPPAQTTPPPAAPAPKPTPTPKATTKPPKSVPAPKAPAAKTPAPAPAAAAPAAPAKAKPKPKPAAKPKRTPKLAAIALAGDAAGTYNPYARPENDFTDAHLAIDGDPQTSWTATFSGDQSGAVGVDVSLGKLVGVRALQLHTATPGMTVEIYASRSETEPVSIQDPGWDHLATQLDVGSSERIRLGDGSARYRHLLVWPTEAPPEGDHVALTELELFR
jgi:hypothetical protein